MSMEWVGFVLSLLAYDWFTQRKLLPSSRCILKIVNPRNQLRIDKKDNNT